MAVHKVLETELRVLAFLFLLAGSSAPANWIQNLPAKILSDAPSKCMPMCTLTQSLTQEKILTQWQGLHARLRCNINSATVATGCLAAHLWKAKLQLQPAVALGGGVTHQ